MRKILVTRMSGAGKSTALAALRRRGFDVVDTDEPGCTKWCDEDDRKFGAAVRAARMRRL